MDSFGNLAMELGNLNENFGIVDLGLDKREGVLFSSTARQHSWEQHLDNEFREFGKVDNDFGKWEMDFSKLEVDFGRLEEDFGMREEDYLVDQLDKSSEKVENNLGNGSM